MINFDLHLTDIYFLQQVIDTAPEVKALAGPSPLATPAGPRVLQPNAWTYRIFDPAHVDPSAVEAERTLVSLLLFKDAYIGHSSRFPSMSPANFRALSALTQSYAPTADDIAFVVYSLACNDLGKTQWYVEYYQQDHGAANATDHDHIYATLLEEAPTLFPGFSKLSAEGQQLYRAGLKAEFNLGQFVQAETLPGSLEGLAPLSPKAQKLRLITELFDIAGATGHANSDACTILNDATLPSFLRALQILETPPLEMAYTRLLTDRLTHVGMAPPLGANASLAPEHVVLGRLLALTRTTTKDKAQIVLKQWQRLSASEQAFLTHELTRSGVTNSNEPKGCLLYYLPALFENLVKSSGNDTGLGVGYGLRMLPSLFDECADRGHPSAQPNMIVLDVADRARAAALSPCTASLKACFPQESIVILGSGGGSDILQATVVGDLLNRTEADHTPKRTITVLSIRSQTPASQTSDGHLAAERRVINPLHTIDEGVFVVGENTTVTGRGVENRAAKFFPTILIIDAKDGRLAAQIQAALNYVGNVTLMINSDTGGDCLHRLQDVSLFGEGTAAASPGQDTDSALAIQAVSQRTGIPASTIILAPGIDAPAYYQEVVKSAGGTLISFSRAEHRRILEIYQSMGCGLESTDFCGKTPLAWQAAIRGLRGPYDLPLPQALIQSLTNPWNPRVTLTSAMAHAIVIPRLQDHIAALRTPAPRPRSQQTEL